jgi:hypothetical protein
MAGGEPLSKIKETFDGDVDTFDCCEEDYA